VYNSPVSPACLQERIIFFLGHCAILGKLGRCGYVMAKRLLRVRAIAKLDSLGLGQAIAAGQVAGELPARHKWNNEASPYCVANEFICTSLGRFIGLPIAPFAITSSDDFQQKFIFSSISVNYNNRDFSPVIPEHCVQHMLDMCSGLLAFDILIANSDRHDENLVVNNDIHPTEMAIYDHDVALFGSEKGAGLERLSAMNGSGLLLKI
jgi:hypothetical protein